MIRVRVSPAPPYANGERPVMSMKRITPRLQTSVRCVSKWVKCVCVFKMGLHMGEGRGQSVRVYVGELLSVRWKDVN